MENSRLKKSALSWIFYVALACLLAYLVLDRAPPTMPVGSVAPIDEKLNLLSGGTTSVRRLVRKPMVINFWATWCPTCHKELPALSKLAKKYRGRIVFLAPAVASNMDDILTAKRKYLIDFDLALVSDDVADKWHARALPTTYVLDADGVVLWAKAGYSTEQDLEAGIALALQK